MSSLDPGKRALGWLGVSLAVVLALPACSHEATPARVGDASARTPPYDAGSLSGKGADSGETAVDASHAPAPAIDARVGSASDAALTDSASTPPVLATDQTASWLVENGDAVFFVGNSFFNWQDRILPQWVTAIGQSVTPKLELQTGAHIVPGNNPLSWFLEQRESQDAIASKKYKIFVLQGEEFEPVEHKEDFQNAVRDYYQAVTRNGGTVMLFMTWDFKWNEGDDGDFLNKLSSAYDEIGKELNIPVIPVGLIYDDINHALPPGEERYFLNGGDLHPTETGAAVNAYATFAMLTGINPMGVVFSANGNISAPDLLQYLSDKSWTRVSMRLHD